MGGRRRSRVSEVFPTGMPVLARGRHDWPAQGACFMEYASVLAGERFSDHPRCTHPVLAAACRVINDQIGDAGRARLVAHVPAVIGARTRDPRVVAVVTLAFLHAAEAYRPGRFDAAQASARRRLGLLSGGRCARAWARLSGPGYVVDACLDLFAAVQVVAEAGGDDGLYALLVDVLAAYHGVAPDESGPAVAPLAETAPGTAPAPAPSPVAEPSREPVAVGR